MAFIKVIIKEFIELSSQFYFTAHLHIFMTYREEIKIEAKSILLKLTSVMEGQMVGRELVETGKWVTQPEAILMGIHAGGEPDPGHVVRDMGGRRDAPVS